MLVALAGLVTAVALARNHDPAEAALLVGLLATCALVTRLLLRDLRAHPANPRARPLAGAAHEETLMLVVLVALATLTLAMAALSLSPGEHEREIVFGWDATCRGPRTVFLRIRPG